MFKSNFLIASLIILGVALFFSSCVNAQNSQFQIGFNEGFKSGYCGKEVNCLPPLPPLPPPLALGESMDSYKDGYDKGFKYGLDAKNNHLNVNAKKASNATSDPIDYMHKENTSELRTLVAENRDKIFNKILDDAQVYYSNGQYGRCIDACKDATRITNLVSVSSYVLLSKSYSALGKKSKSKKYDKLALKQLSK